MNIKYTLLLCILLALISSCCYKKASVPVINIEYTEVNTNDMYLNVYITYSGNQNSTEYEILSARTASSYQLDLINDEEIVDYILILGDSIRTDTISNINIRNYGRCNTKMDISYDYKNSTKTNETLTLY